MFPFLLCYSSWKHYSPATPSSLSSHDFPNTRAEADLVSLTAVPFFIPALSDLVACVSNTANRPAVCMCGSLTGVTESF